VRKTCELKRLLWFARTLTSRRGRSGPRREVGWSPARSPVKILISGLIGGALLKLRSVLADQNRLARQECECEAP
jgi:hypothetical protein